MLEKLMFLKKFKNDSIYTKSINKTRTKISSRMSVETIYKYILQWILNEWIFNRQFYNFYVKMVKTDNDAAWEKKKVYSHVQITVCLQIATIYLQYAMYVH